MEIDHLEIPELPRLPLRVIAPEISWIETGGFSLFFDPDFLAKAPEERMKEFGLSPFESDVLQERFLDLIIRSSDHRAALLYFRGAVLCNLATKQRLFRAMRDIPVFREKFLKLLSIAWVTRDHQELRKVIELENATDYHSEALSMNGEVLLKESLLRALCLTEAPDEIDVSNVKPDADELSDGKVDALIEESEDDEDEDGEDSSDLEEDSDHEDPVDDVLDDVDDGYDDQDDDEDHGDPENERMSIDDIDF